MPSNYNDDRFERIENKLDNVLERLVRLETILSEATRSRSSFWVRAGVMTSFLIAATSIVIVLLNLH